MQKCMENHDKDGTQWESLYQQGQTGWDRGKVSPNLNYWLAQGLLKPCRILIPGCGNGYEVLALAQYGFEVVAIDIAATPIENLRQKLKDKEHKVELVHADFFTWQCQTPFDAIYEQTSLCALQPKQWINYEQCLRHWLKPQGKLFAQFMQTGQEDGPPFHCDISAMKDIFNAEQWLWSERYETNVIHSEFRHEQLFLLEKVKC